MCGAGATEHRGATPHTELCSGVGFCFGWFDKLTINKLFYFLMSKLSVGNAWTQTHFLELKGIPS
jgi:hypothetical protein